MPNPRPDTDKDLLRVLLIGATGVFGQRLAKQLAIEPGVRLVLCARDQGKLEALKQRLGEHCELASIDRNHLMPSQLLALRCQVVIDAAGPFQDSHLQVIEASIVAGCHYLDLADGREFVNAIRQFHEQALDANIAVISGASSTPALSHAVIDHLTKDWQRKDTIKVAISPGNRAPRGLSVVKAILSYVGKPVRVFRKGEWTNVPGWGLTHSQPFPGLGKRLLSVCETPDQDLLVERYQPTTSAEFYAGLELKFLHLALAGMGWLVRLKIMRSLTALAKPLLWLANCVESWGTDRGGMLVQVSGLNKNNKPAKARWSLLAEAGLGPYVPTFAALLVVRKIRDETLSFRGASSCAGILLLDDFNDRFNHFSIKTKIPNL